MNFAENVDKDFIDLVLESALWNKSGVDVKKNAEVVTEETNEGPIGTVPELEGEVANEYEEPQDIEVLEDGRDEDTFSLEDLEYVLNHLADDDLMEHASYMLDVFDQAEQALLEAGDPGDEDEEDVEAEAEAEEEAEEEAEDALVSEAILSLLEAKKRRQAAKKKS